MNIGKKNLLLGGVVGSVLLLTAMAASSDREDAKKPRDATLVGRVVDLHSAMTGKFATSDPVRATRMCIRAGVPAAIEMPDGLVIIGHGPKGPQKLLAKLAYEQVEIKGRLYERGGLRYIDMTDVKLAKAAEEPEDDEYDEPEYVEPDPEEPDEPEPEPADRGACCLGEGECNDTDEEHCAELDGDFYRGERCDEIECPSAPPVRPC